jgi:hypothetical protein
MSMSLWLPSQVAGRLGWFHFSVPSFVYGLGTLMWLLFSFYQRLIGVPILPRLTNSVFLHTPSIDAAWPTH